MPAPLSTDQLQAITDARRRMKKIRRAIGVATFDGWTIAIFAVFTFLGGFWGASGFVLGIGLGVIAAVELRSAGRLKKLEADAARMLGFNQLALAGLLIAYAAWCLLSPAALPSDVISSAQELKSIGIDLEEMQKTLNLLIYWALIVIAVCAQGSLALFYFRREKLVREYLSQAPEWIVQMQHAGMEL